MEYETFVEQLVNEISNKKYSFLLLKNFLQEIPTDSNHFTETKSHPTQIYYASETFTSALEL